jgi:hypothetical protein
MCLITLTWKNCDPSKFRGLQMIAPLKACNDVHQFTHKSTSITTNFDVETAQLQQHHLDQERKKQIATQRILCGLLED